MRQHRWKGWAVVSLASVWALAVQGYHPYSEDGGLYIAGIKKTLDPRLYSVRPEFVLAHQKFSPFAQAMAAVVRVSHLPLDWILFALYVGSVWLTLYGAWMLASRCGSSNVGRAGAVALLACWLTIPIAGTSLMLMDPYVTARSVSTPLALLAISWALDGLAGDRRGWLLCGLALVLAAVHPLMAGYALGAVAVLAAVSSQRPRSRRWAPLLLGTLALLLAGGIYAWAPAESPAYLAAELTRYYWFPLWWHWYEELGLLAPLLLVAVLQRSRETLAWRALAGTAIWLGVIALAVALAFARVGLAKHLVARLQPLRSFQIVYEIMIILLGAWFAEHWLRCERWRWVLMLGVLGSAMFAAQRSIYPGSQHFEAPWRSPVNPWVRAFVWVRENTPNDALFALDANYITRDGEDAQGFRGIAERSALPDYSKDGGEASITPALAKDWAAGVAAQHGLERATDAARLRSLAPLGVSWIVLERASLTHWSCHYSNEAVKVCRLPEP